MLVNIDWLRKWVELPDNLNAVTLAESLVKVGLEEEMIHSSGVTGPIVLGIVQSIAGEVQKNGKTINYCRVDVGQFNDTTNDVEKELQSGSRGIICGANNFAIGDQVVVALPGAVLPDDFAISSRKTYGHISNGMQCSARELGLGEEHDGIIVLNKSQWSSQIEHLQPGDDLKLALGLDCEILEINITPDRGYCFSYRGIGREYALSTGAKFTDLVLENAKLASDLVQADQEVAQIHDNNPIYPGIYGCNKFATIRVNNINSGALTPDWMKLYLESVGQRSISLPVDITNYIMLHFGQPLHAYDADQVVLPIVVRRALADEMLQTLDNKLHQLDVEDLLITDSQGGLGVRPIGVAGVMGGASTEVTVKTRNILIESAYFEPVTISRSARRHKLPSLASKRFERGIDPEMQEAAAYLAAWLLIKYGTDQDPELMLTPEKSPILVQVQPNSSTNSVSSLATNSTNYRVIEFKISEVERLIGITIEAAQIEYILTSIGCHWKYLDSKLHVTPPSWRPDLTIPADLVEEVGRIWGYDKIPSYLPIVKPELRTNAGKSMLKSELSNNNLRHISNTLAARGYTEVISYPFTMSGSVELANPLAGDKSYLCETLLEPLIETASLNLRRANNGVQLFEVGKVFRAKPNAKSISILPVGQRPDSKALGAIEAELPNQPTHIAGIIAHSQTQQTNDDNWKLAIQEVLHILSSLHLQTSAKIEVASFGTYSPIMQFTKQVYHPTRSADIAINGTIVARAGQLNTWAVDTYNLPSSEKSAAFEINFDKLSKFRTTEPFNVTSISTFPPAYEDYAFVVDSEVLATDVVTVIKRATKKIEPAAELSVTLFDEFSSEKLGTSKKSLSFQLIIRTNHTLSSDDIRQIRNEIISSVAEFGGHLRD